MSDPQGSKTTEIECEGDSAASCQTPTNDQGPDNHEAPVERLPVQIEQPSNAYLVKMPSEIILSITEHMDRQNLRSLALTSSRLHHTVRDEFYRSSNYETFHLALEAGDFAAIKRCIERKVASADAVWRPINYLMPAFEKDKMTADQCFYVLRWLVRNGGDLATACTNFKPGSMDKQAQFARTLRHMPHLFLRAFGVEADKTKLEGAANIICYLLAQGFTLPREVQFVDYGSMRITKDLEYRDSIPGFVPLTFHSHSPMAWIMREPPMRPRLGLVGQVYEPKTVKYDTLTTEFWGLVMGLFNDLLDPLIWKPVYDGEVGDIWEAKLKLLDTHQGLDDFEKRHFLSILAALRKIEVKIRAEGGLDIERDEEACWRELWSALPDFAGESEVLKFDDGGRCPADRVHRFGFRRIINPVSYWDNRGSIVRWGVDY
ncbi:hypothetical protein NCS56_00020400 [Fusarium sp. Ph1]|nr:hypothetical protein NCS56_00020400 [Fusarium sp. Ph1]